MACTITRFKSHMELREKMQNSHSPKLNDGLTSKAKHDIFEGVLSSLAKKFYKPELLENGWHEAVANHRPIIEGAPTVWRQANVPVNDNQNSRLSLELLSSYPSTSRAASPG
jgi:hypothetical protein